MKIINIKTTDIKPYDKNPRKNDDAVDMVANSIKEFGFKVPIIIDKNNVIVTGHTRHKAAKKLGLKEVPVIIADDLSEEQIKAFRLVDNKVGEIAEWDFNLLGEELDELLLFDIDMADFGFEIKLDNEEEVEEDDFDGELPEEPKAKLGDIYVLGNHRLVCGDSTNEADVDKLMEGELADLVLIDPPYNVNYGEKANMLNDYAKGHRITDSIINDHMPTERFYNFLFDLFTQMSRITRAGGAAYVFHSESERVNFTKAFQEVGFYFSETLIWAKTQLVLTRLDYHYQHEPILYGWKIGAGHYFSDDRTQTTIIKEGINIDKMKIGELRDYVKSLHEQLPSTILEESKPSKNDLHPTMKPIRLCAKLINNSTKAGEIVYDGCGGSGSTLMAAEQTGRAARLMELDPKYCDVIINRWEQFTGKKAEKIN